MAGSYQEARRRQADGSQFENLGDATEAMEDTLVVVDELLAALERIYAAAGSIYGASSDDLQIARHAIARAKDEPA